MEVHMGMHLLQNSLSYANSYIIQRHHSKYEQVPSKIKGQLPTQRLWNSHTPYNRLFGQQMLSGTQIISTSHGMTGRNFFDVFLPFYLLFGF